MINQLKHIIRYASQNKLISLLNIVGLAIGIACSIFLISWVMHESSYDSFVKEKDRIYRVNFQLNYNGEDIKTSQVFSGVGEEVTSLYPEVDAFTRLSHGFFNSIIKTEKNDSERANGYAADSNFFSIFQYPIIAGNLKKALSEPNSIVIDEQLASSCFGKEYAIGKTLYIDKQAFNVTAVIERVPSNSHLQFRFIVPTSNMPKWWSENLWGSDNTILYLQLQPHTKVSDLSAKMSTLIDKNCSGFYKEHKFAFYLAPIGDLPFDNTYKFDDTKKSSKNNIIMLSAIAIFLLLIACSNFTNLFVSTSLKRKTAIGIKITSGASKARIIREFFTEVLVYVMIAFVLSIILLEVLHPLFARLSGSSLKLDYFSLRFLYLSLPILLLTIVLAGFFPGIYLTKFNPSDIFKGAKSGRKSNVQKSLVTAQFVIASMLIFAVVVVSKQIHFLQSKNLGFDKENVVYIHTLGELSKDLHLKRLQNELINDPNIASISYRSGLPTSWGNGNPLYTQENPTNQIGSEEVLVDGNYFDLMNIEFLEGENVFGIAHDSMNYCILNERAAETLRLEPPYVDQTIFSVNNNQAQIIKGVVKNVNNKSLYQQVDPCMYISPTYYSKDGILLFKVVNNTAKAIEAVKAYWEKENPNQPFEYWFLDKTYDNLYKSEIQTRKIIVWFTGIAIILTILGLLAMAYFTTESRIKEIGIRKVNGAGVSEILTLLNQEFAKWVAVAFVIACPIGYFVMNKWLENFAYKTTMSWWIFALVGGITLLIALGTVSFHSWKAARKNPVEALRYE